MQLINRRRTFDEVINNSSWIIVKVLVFIIEIEIDIVFKYSVIMEWRLKTRGFSTYSASSPQFRRDDDPLHPLHLLHYHLV